MFKFGFLLDAAADAGNAGEGGQSGGLGSMILPIVMIGILIIFFIFSSRRQKKQQTEEAQMRDNLQVGDEVTTIGGIIGKVVSVKGETFVLETTKDKTKIRFLKGAIRSVDVKAADLAAQIIEAKNAEAAETTEAEAEFTEESGEAEA